MAGSRLLPSLRAMKVVALFLVLVCGHTDALLSSRFNVHSHQGLSWSALSVHGHSGTRVALEPTPSDEADDHLRLRSHPHAQPRDPEQQQRCSSLVKNRRHAIGDMMAAPSLAAAAMLSSPASSNAAPLAAAAPASTPAYTAGPFTFEVPTNWKIIIQPNQKSFWFGQLAGDSAKFTLFSAIDLQSGAVITINEERACKSAADFARQDVCDFVLDVGNGSADRSKFVTKLLIRHDDRDNVSLRGTTELQSYEETSFDKLDIFATTTIPTGGTYRDTMGLDRPNTISRTVRAKAIIADDLVYSLWLTAPSDEWRKPVVGTKLLQLWSSIGS